MQKKKNIPALRFRGFNEEWEEDLFENINPLQRGFDLPKKQLVLGRIPVIMSNGIGALHNVFKVKGPGVVTGRSGTIGNVHYIKENYWPHNTTLWVTDFNNNYPYFCYLILKNINLNKFSTGSGVPTLNRNDVHQEKIYIPHLNEQIQISNFYSNLDTLLTKHQTQHQKLQALKKAMLSKLFPKKGETTPEIRFKGFTGDWEEIKISNLFKVTRGSVLSASLTTDKKTKKMKYPVYSSQTKYNGLMGYYDEYLFENAVTWTTDGANAGTVKYRKGKFYSTNVNGVLLSDEGFASEVIAEILNNEAWKHVSHVGNPKLMNNVMADIKITIPNSIKEIEILSNYLNIFNSLITKHATQIEKLGTIKKACLSKMFV
ncbi:restriction endonuclease subunit S [Tenacibaculum dicentrarchi]|nr:restriction endonuclease subunit S [Tenacibaculum dicentrarchi]